MDLGRLKRGDQVIVVAGLVLVIASFFDWLSLTIRGETGSGNAWDFTLAWLGVLLGIVMLAQVVLSRLMDVKFPDPGNLTWGQVHLALGVAAFLMILIKLLVGVNIDTAPFGDEVDVDREIAFFIGVVAAGGLAVGGFLKSQEDGRSRGSA